MRRIHSTRGIVLATALAAIAGACTLDEATGPSRQLGDPLLDIGLGPASDGLFPTGSYTLTSAASRDTITVRFQNLPALPAGRRYQVFLVDSVAAATSPRANRKAVSGRLITTTSFSRPVTRDSTFFGTRVDTVADVGAIEDGGVERSYVMRIVDPDIPTYSHVVLAVVDDAAPGTRQEPADRFGFLWARYRNAATATPTYANTGTFTFGSFALAEDRRLPFSFGSAQVAGFFRGNTLRVNVRQLVRPPQGFQYAGWLLDARTGESVRIGSFQTPVPYNQPLDGADVDENDFIIDDVLVEAQLRGDATALGGIRWQDYTRLVIVLEPKGDAPPAVPPAAVLLAGAVPPSVADRSAAPGKLSGTVTGGSRVGATVYLTGPRSTTPVLVTSANAEGAFLFRSVAVGQYRAYVIPAGGTTPSDSTTVTIAERLVNGAMVGDSLAITLNAP